MPGSRENKLLGAQSPYQRPALPLVLKWSKQAQVALGPLPIQPGTPTQPVSLTRCPEPEYSSEEEARGGKWAGAGRKMWAEKVLHSGA